MKRWIAAVLLIAVVGCSSKPCVDGERVSAGGAWGFGSTRTTYDPCSQKCAAAGWTRGCACTPRCPCWERHPK